jgi:hypothetical protein
MFTDVPHWYVYSVGKIAIIFPAMLIEKNIMNVFIMFSFIGEIKSTPLIPRQRGI